MELELVISAVLVFNVELHVELVISALSVFNVEPELVISDLLVFSVELELVIFSSISVGCRSRSGYLSDLFSVFIFICGDYRSSTVNFQIYQCRV